MKEFLKALPKHVKLQLILLFVFPLNLLLVLLANLFPDAVENIYSRGVFPSIMQVISKITGVLPFSLAEVLVVTAVIFGATMLALAIRRITVTAKQKGRVWLLLTDYISRVLAVALCAVLLFNLLYGLSYYRKNTTAEVYDRYISYTTEDLAWVACYLVEDLNGARKALNISETEPVKLTLSHSELGDEVLEAYEMLGEKYPVYAGSYGKPKPVALSKPWTYTFVMGMYFPFTGEANYNTNIPAAELGHTILHEMAHQRGIAAEDEANFAAFLAGIHSDNAYIRYSALFESFTFVASAVRNGNSELYELLMETVDAGVKTDIEYVNEFWEDYTTPVAELSNSINNAYLESNGVEMGVASYSLSVQYILDYYVNTYLSDYISKG